jgi:hypothetical protein
MSHASKTARAKLNKKSKRQLLALLIYFLTILKTTNPRAYRSAEKRLGLRFSKTERKRRRRKGKHRKHGGKSRKKGRKLRAGVHNVRIRGKMRKVRVLENGRWRFMKS